MRSPDVFIVRPRGSKAPQDAGSNRLVRIGESLSRRLARLRFEAPITHVYNPLQYAKAPHQEYLRRYGGAPKEVVLVGMNPGPWGMVQTGIPFGEVSLVRDWLGVQATVGKPKDEHPKRPVLGFDCCRREVSGARLWGWAKDTFGKPERFFARFFVANYCPLAFFDTAGRNITPDQLPARSSTKLFGACDAALRALVEHLRPRWVIGVGQFAEARAREALGGCRFAIARILHPSPASPAANNHWAEKIARQLQDLGVRLPGTAP